MYMICNERAILAKFEESFVELYESHFYYVLECKLNDSNYCQNNILRTIS